MRLNIDCVRDVLIYLEENLCYIERYNNSIEHKEISMRTIAGELVPNNDYTEHDVFYAIEQLIDAKYIYANASKGTHDTIFTYKIFEISWDGHQFLNTVRPKTVWEATKQGAAKLGIMSMHALSTIAMSVTQAVITDPTVIGKIVAMLG